ncbi:influenza virus NS1A-binding protein [Cimex lectularius]|uniref:Kelch-like protein diablo n=1 Tax=Cimex lectularius TaxID=79782 RepID=A0A8I6S9R9_CIMLE|nr:influenza virus NS1A-binding protein [Cimex lectularius]
MGTNGYSDSGELEDEAVARPKEATLVYEDSKNASSILHSLNMMRKNTTFCDVVLHVDHVGIPAHKAVLSAASPHLMQIFTADDERSPKQNVVNFKLNGIFEKVALEKLVDYAYTSRLELSPHQVRSVFIAATHLKMERVANECASYLVKNLNVDTCIEIRGLPGISKEKDFLSQVDAYINTNFADISKSPVFLALPCLQVEVLSQTRSEMSLVDCDSAARLVLDWLRVCELGAEQLTEKTHMLYLALDNTLKDCVDLPSGEMGDTQIVQDYKKLSKNMTKKRAKAVAPAKPRVIVYSRNISDSSDEDVGHDDKVIASTPVSKHTFLGLISLKSRVFSLSILLRLNPPTDGGGQQAFMEIDATQDEEDPGAGTPTYCALASMASVKCAAGCANLNERLLVCGGYDRGECLRSTEIYLPITNEWKDLSPMLEPRGRFNIAVVNGLAYAIGGCNGTNELSGVEIYSEQENKWERISSLPLPRSHTAVASLDGLIYCIGGFNDQVGIKQCDLFDPKTRTWTEIEPLHTGRYQAAACGFMGKVWVVGGCDGWSYLGSVEVYDPVTKEWSYAGHLATPRRGPGLQVFQGKLYCVGGWDGTHSLSSTEVYDPETKSWTPGPSMTTARSNLGLAVAGSKLYAVGGFSNKTFLNSIEVLATGDDQEWTTFCLKSATDQVLD